MSSWERLLDTCTHNFDYRARLAAALARDDDAEIGALLKEIEAQGASPGDLAARVAALKATYGPMLALAEQLDPSVRMAP